MKALLVVLLSLTACSAPTFKAQLGIVQSANALLNETWRFQNYCLVNYDQDRLTGDHDCIASPGPSLRAEIVKLVEQTDCQYDDEVINGVEYSSDRQDRFDYIIVCKGVQK